MSIFLKITENYGNQEKAARALGVAPSTFSDWVAGKKIPNKKNIRVLISAGFTANEIVETCFNTGSSDADL
jgi:DNA-binding transcriptional regulator YdaS (Cro superfamily)